jgi:hypothetical protein
VTDVSVPQPPLTAKRRPRSTRLGAWLGLGALAAVMATSTASTPTASAQSALSSDYAVEAFGDAWDWSNVEDGGPAPDLLSNGISGSSIENGQLNFTVDRPSFWFFLQGGYADSIPTGRDASGYPVDTTRYNRLVFRMSASANVSAALLWFGCPEGDNCVGGVPIDIKAGTHTYDLALGAPRILSRAWTGKISAMRFDFNPQTPAQISLDWVRLTDGSGPIDQWNGPQLEIVDPDETGGDDYATIARNGDAWDFDQATDMLRSDNAVTRVEGGHVVGVNAPPAMNDPSVTVKVPKAFYGDDFHRMTVKWSFEGPFSLRDEPGGGMNARIVWRIAGTPPTSTGLDLQESRDIVMYATEPQFTLNLKTNPSVAITDPRPNKKQIGWAGQLIELVRFDPNEDPGARRWKVDSIKLAADDKGGDSFTIKLADRSPSPGTVVDVYSDTDRAGFDGELIARNVDLSSGSASVKWTPPAGTKGTFWIYATSRRGTTGVTRYSTGPVQMGVASGPSAYTFGPAVGGPASQVGISDITGGPEPDTLGLTPAPAPSPAASPTPKTTVPKKATSKKTVTKKVVKKKSSPKKN